ncbi:putative ATP-dependent helicase [Enhygromyxa salina]|uniref:Putative ATP-dependent helicase n=1 Tax=Enhygromyxa salina TaxID=215803 RepID=A0A0C2DDX7_9BACT|nr:hypothetical protein [Enhygromyxa salina]KIG19645.1 putative ATP-dependent helicase [Enhygromyxa salina]
MSEIVRYQEAMILEEVEPEIRVLDPRQTQFISDTSSQHRASLLSTESVLRDVPPPVDGLYIGPEALEQLLPKAVDAVKRRLEADRAELGPKLNNEFERLEARRLEHIESLIEHRRDPRAELTTADESFLQVIASVVGGAA